MPPLLKNNFRFSELVFQAIKLKSIPKRGERKPPINPKSAPADCHEL